MTLKMIRIQTANNPGGITIAIDGQLVGEYVEEVEASIRKEQANSARTCICSCGIFLISMKRAIRCYPDWRLRAWN